MVLNQDNYIIPASLEQPVWVQTRIEKFTSKIQEIAKSSLSVKLMKDEIIDLLETYILHDSYKITKKITSKEISNILNVYETNISNNSEFMWYYYLLMNSGFLLNSIFPSSFSPESLQLPAEFKKRKFKLADDLKNEKITPAEYQSSISKLSKELKEYFSKNGYDIIDLIESGAKGKLEHIQELLLGVGISVTATGELNDVICNSLSDGLDQTQFFNKSSTAIGALYAKSVETAKPGYLGRRMNAIGERVVLSSKKDCGSKKYLKLRVQNAAFFESLIGRTLKSGEMITDTMNLIGKEIEIRSPFYCKAEDGICETCYNKQYVKKWKLSTNAPIGIMASTNMTGSLVNLTLKKSHVGINNEYEPVNFKEDLKKMF